MSRVKLKVRFAGTSENGMFLKGNDGKLYTWNTKNFLHPLFSSNGKEIFEITASLTTDEILNINWLKNVRILKSKENAK